MDLEHQRHIVLDKHGDYVYKNPLTNYVTGLSYKSLYSFARNKSRVLEVGCGEGAFFKYLKTDTGFDYVGCDKSIVRLLFGVNRPNTKFIQCDATRLPLKDSTFDLVISISTLEHIRELELLFSEIKRVMTNTGVFVVSVPTEGGLAWKIGRQLITRRYYERVLGEKCYMDIIAMEHVNDCKLIVRKLTQHFKIIKKKYVPFWIPSVHLNAYVTMACMK